MSTIEIKIENKEHNNPIFQYTFQKRLLLSLCFLLPILGVLLLIAIYFSLAGVYQGICNIHYGYGFGEIMQLFLCAFKYKYNRQLTYWESFLTLVPHSLLTLLMCAICLLAIFIVIVIIVILVSIPIFLGISCYYGTMVILMIVKGCYNFCRSTNIKVQKITIGTK